MTGPAFPPVAAIPYGETSASLTWLQALAEALAEADNAQKVLSTALAKVLALPGVESARISLLYEESLRAAPVTYRALSCARFSESSVLPYRPQPDDDVLAPHQPRPQVEAPPGDQDDLDVPEPTARCACATLPIPGARQAVGYLFVVSRSLAAFSPELLQLLGLACTQVSIVVENHHLREAANRAEALAILVQEMHHRIKNNLQTVADLLSLEMSSTRSYEARRSLRDSISRIKSLAAVHEMLSLEQLRLTDITELARHVSEVSLRNLLRPHQQVKALVSGPSIFLPSKQATALALVLNELIANALEHAFPGADRQGRLAITLAEEGSLVTLTIGDNGRGLPSGFDLSAEQGLGLRIARTLAEKDLAGTLRLENRVEGGAQATLVFYK